MAKRERGSDDPVVIKKYANRRLYNTSTSSYVTLEHLADMVKEDIEFVVYDAKSGDDITRSVLAQIIFEAEGKDGQNVLPLNFLRQLISFYGDSLQGVLPSYLDMSMDAFSRNREQMTEQFGQGLGTPMKQFEEATRRNMEMFEKTMAMFNPFAPRGTGQPSQPAEPEDRSGSSDGDDIGQLKGQLDDMQRQLEKLMKGRG